MTKRAKQPAVKGLRTRRRANGTVRCWWEPSASERRAGAEATELDADRPTWSAREAARLNREAAALLSGQPVKRSGGRTIDALIDDYLNSPSFARLTDSSKESYRSNINAIAAKWGPQPVAEFDTPVMYQWYRALARERGNWVASALIRMMSILFKHSARIGWRNGLANPCADLGIERSKGRTRVATWAEIDACIAAAATLELRAIHTALHLVVFHGQRQKDICKAQPNDFIFEDISAADGGSDTDPTLVWYFRRSKRGNKGALVVHPDAKPVILEAQKRATNGPGTLIWDERTGKIFDRHSFFALWEAVRNEAAKTAPTVLSPVLQWRDFRRTFAAMARRHSDTHDIADVLGNTADTNDDLRQTYMPRELATSARVINRISRPEKPERKKA